MRPTHTAWVLMIASASLAACASPVATSAAGVTAKVGVTVQQRTVQDAPYRWTAADVFEYVATLLQQQPDLSFQPVQSVLPIVLLQAGTPQTVASFPNLTRGLVYQVSVVALGNQGGSAATTTLNTQTPTNVSLDLSTPINQGLSEVDVTANVSLDPEAGDPSTSLGISLPIADGVFTAPSALPTIAPTVPFAWGAQ